MSRTCLVVLSIAVVMSCAETKKFRLPTYPPAPPTIQFSDERVDDGAPFGRFEEVFDGQLEGFVIAPVLDAFHGRPSHLRVRLLDLRWTWNTGPFFLARVTAVARLRVELVDPETKFVQRVVRGSSVKTEQTPTGESLRIAGALLLEALVESVQSSVAEFRLDDARPGVDEKP